MNDIMKEINTAYGLLASIPVRGDAVDAAAACRMALRKAYKLAEAQSAREQEDAGGHKGRPYGGGETEQSGVCEDESGEDEA